jgi:hypothetical protein
MLAGLLGIGIGIFISGGGCCPHFSSAAAFAAFAAAVAAAAFSILDCNGTNRWGEWTKWLAAMAAAADRCLQRRQFVQSPRFGFSINFEGRQTGKGGSEEDEAGNGKAKPLAAAGKGVGKRRAE